MSEWDDLQIRVHGESAHPTLIYLPGVHGDWTLVSSFRAAIRNHVRFVEFTYPRTLTWSINDHAHAIVQKLSTHNIREGWLLAESFGSVLAWALVDQAPPSNFHVCGIILSGGFVRYPYLFVVRFARAINRALPLWFIKLVCWFYGRYALLRHRHAPETLECVSEFARRRSEESDRHAICYRYGLILQSDPRQLAQKSAIPVYQLCGLVDPIVPWFPVRRWLRRYCPKHTDWRLVWRADHNVLGTAPRTAADQVLRWIGALQAPG
jgi:pimeloyl-ACP methyl ester carboxylesterase